MSIIHSLCSKSKWSLVWSLVFLLAGAALAYEPFVVRPVKTPGDVRPLPAEAWPPPESEQGGMLLKLSYLRGVIDALQYTEVAPQTVGQVLDKLQGMTLQELAAAIDRYYLADPRRRQTPPASVLLRVLPQQRGKVEPSPLPRTPAPRP